MYETMQIAVNSVINWSFFLLYLLFSIFSSNFIDSESGIELRIRRLDTWRHRARDHSTRHRPLPTCWWSFGTKPVSPVVFEILASNSIGSRRHFRVTWHHRLRDHSIPRYPFPIGTPLSPSRYLHPFSEIMGTKHIGVMSLTFQGHVTSSVTWPLDSGWVISYR